MGNPSERYDPLTTFCFALEISALLQGKAAFFKSISGLKSESEVVSYPEGGLNTGTRQLVGPTKWPNLVLKRGFTGAAELINWRQSFLDDKPGRQLKRYDGKVIQLSSDLKPICEWSFVGGWPCRWEGPEFDASKNELAIETLEIAHEGLFFKKVGGR
jgi:phage tail-like protein